MFIKIGQDYDDKYCSLVNYKCLLYNILCEILCGRRFIWIIFFGWEMALGNLIVGCIWCITIVGIPFGKQFFKMARLSFMPFGASVIG